MAPGGRVLIMDPVLPPGDTPHTSKLMDVLCMAIYEEVENVRKRNSADCWLGLIYGLIASSIPVATHGIKMEGENMLADEITSLRDIQKIIDSVK
ncbi:hypothetical protein J31TS6_30470 [Brevibacillus reuszeri]|nr:hypothetical protein J31TS6_30470 [Brevibacillus reuszeri]